MVIVRMGYENRINVRVIGASAALPAVAIVRVDEDPGRSATPVPHSPQEGIREKPMP